MDYNHNFPIDLAQQSEFRLVLNLSVHGNYNPGLVWMNPIPVRFRQGFQKEFRGRMFHTVRVITLVFLKCWVVLRHVDTKLLSVLHFYLLNIQSKHNKYNFS